ncbi:MAG: hypothetical protein LBQ83_00170 [Candidatus Margulisbacteria bacterium]|jgi:hypothetical protein|nr:hypothetical protein [Candidatus Margulisiibacteriota bacterium]
MNSKVIADNPPKAINNKIIADHSPRIIIPLSRKEEYKAFFLGKNLHEYFNLHVLPLKKYYELEFKTAKIIPYLFVEDVNIFLPEDLMAIKQGFQKNDFVRDTTHYALLNYSVRYRIIFNHALARLPVLFTNYDRNLHSALQEIQEANAILKKMRQLLHEVSAQAAQHERTKVARDIEHAVQSFQKTAKQLQAIITKYGKTTGTRKHCLKLLQELTRNSVIQDIHSIMDLIEEILNMSSDRSTHQILNNLP